MPSDRSRVGPDLRGGRCASNHGTDLGTRREPGEREIEQAVAALGCEFREALGSGDLRVLQESPA